LPGLLPKQGANAPVQRGLPRFTASGAAVAAHYRLKMPTHPPRARAPQMLEEHAHKHHDSRRHLVAVEHHMEQGMSFESANAAALKEVGK
jgi:hypothetical protein